MKRSTNVIGLIIVGLRKKEVRMLFGYYLKYKKFPKLNNLDATGAVVGCAVYQGGVHEFVRF